MEFIQKYAKIDGDDDSDHQMSDAGSDEVNYSNVEFIDDDEQNVQGQNSSDYCLMNVTRDLQEALRDHSISAELGECSDPENFVPDCIDELKYEYDEFKGFQERIEKFAKGLKAFEENSKDSFYNAILFGAYHALLDNKKNFEFDQSTLAEVLRQNFFDELQGKKEIIQLDLKPSNFQMLCHIINGILMNKRLFYEFTSSEKSFVISLRKCLRIKTLYEGISRPVSRSDSTVSILLEELLKTNKKRTMLQLTLSISQF